MSIAYQFGTYKASIDRVNVFIKGLRILADLADQSVGTKTCYLSISCIYLTYLSGFLDETWILNGYLHLLLDFKPWAFIIGGIKVGCKGFDHYKPIKSFTKIKILSRAICKDNITNVSYL